MKNRSSKTILVFLALGLISCALCVQQAQAVPITGAITFAGGVEMDGTVNTATQVTGWLDENGFMPTVQSCSGSYASFVTAGDTAMFPNAWSFTFAGSMVLWQVDGFTFNLIASHIVFQGNGFLNVSGTGTVSGNGFDDTAGSWNFSIQDDSASGVFSFSASGQSLPDGGPTVALLGVALAGIEGIRRKFRRAKN